MEPSVIFPSLCVTAFVDFAEFSEFVDNANWNEILWFPRSGGDDVTVSTQCNSSHVNIKFSSSAVAVLELRPGGKYFRGTMTTNNERSISPFL